LKEISIETRKKELLQHDIDGSRPSSDIYAYSRPFCIGSKGSSYAGNRPFGDAADLTRII
jgi:hypothetical protein